MLCEGSIAPVSSPHAPPPPAADAFALARASTSRGPEVAPTSRHSWLPARGQPVEKLCVHLSVSLRARLDRAHRSLRHYPDIAAVLRSRNALMAYACHRLGVELEAAALTGGGEPPTEHTEPSADELGLLEQTPTSADTGAGTSLLPRWAASAPLYRMPWETDFAERRCQLTLRVPPTFAARLRERHTGLLAAPRHTLRPELAAVFTFSELVALACHELCELIEADNPWP